MSEQTKTWNKYIHKVQNYETDQMGIVHHSNYIRWFEEARCDLLDYMGVGFADLEKQGIISPILSVEADYLRMVYYGDTVSIDAYIKEYNGIKLTVGYEVKDDRTGMVHCRGTSKHCFIDKTGRPLVLRKSFPELNEAFEAGVKVHKENKKALIKLTVFNLLINHFKIFFCNNFFPMYTYKKIQSSRTLGDHHYECNENTTQLTQDQINYLMKITSDVSPDVFENIVMCFCNCLEQGVKVEQVSSDFFMALFSKIFT